MWAIQTNRRKLGLLSCVCLALTLSVLFYWFGNDNEWKMKAMDSILVLDWSGFGPEKGVYNFTLVTAMVDIGRGSWKSQRVPYNTYLLYMQRVLKLDVNMVVFVDPKGKPFIEWMRRGRENRTHIITISIQELPYYQLRERMAEIMDSPSYKQDNELVDKKLCESYIPEYDIIQLSKLYFMDRTVETNPFNTSYFIWMDGGYGKGKDIHPADGVWIPQGLFEYENQTTFIERTPGVMSLAPLKDKLHKMSINILVGGFFAGGGKAIRELYLMQKEQLAVWMKEGVVDDDQTMNMHMYYQKPSLFHLVPGDWYDTFKLFNAHDT